MFKAISKKDWRCETNKLVSHNTYFNNTPRLMLKKKSNPLDLNSVITII